MKRAKPVGCEGWSTHHECLLFEWDFLFGLCQMKQCAPTVEAHIVPGRRIAEGVLCAINLSL